MPMFQTIASLMLPTAATSQKERPSMGSGLTVRTWTETKSAGIIVMCPGGYPIKEAQLALRLPAGHLPGNLYHKHRNNRIDQLIENIRTPTWDSGQQRRQLDLVQEFNRRHEQQRQQDAQLEARIQSMELATGCRWRPPMPSTSAGSRSPFGERYGPGTQARQILIARRLAERGVRYIQVWHGAGQPWDNHEDIEANHRMLAQQSDQAIGALLTDLKERGMWTTPW